MYASIARAVQTSGRAVPELTRTGRRAVDHSRFYGPVFFQIVARSFDVLGFSIRSLRIVTLAFALTAAFAAALLTAFLGGSTRRRWLAFTALLLTPSLGAAATSGRMDSTAVAFELLALAALVHGMTRGRPAPGGVTAGVFLALAAVTTPRTYPFLAATVLAATTLRWWPAPARARAVGTVGVALVTLAVLLLPWMFARHGSPEGWFRYFFYIASRESSDVGLLLNLSERRWWALPWTVFTSAMALLGALEVSRHVRLVPAADARAEAGPAAFVLTIALVNFVACVCVFNITFAFAAYFAVPLLAVLLAMPLRSVPIRREAVATFVAVLLLGGVTFRVVKYARVAATWEARDPERFERFIAAHVPPGSYVFGPDDFFYTPVERVGAEYISIEPSRGAEWAQWVTQFDPGELQAVPMPPRTARRLLAWPTDEDDNPIPAAFDCARPHVIAAYETPDNALDELGYLGLDAGLAGYPDWRLYELPPACPSGPTAPPGRATAP